MTHRIRSLAAIAVTGLAAACGGSETTSSTGQVAVRMVDSPGPEVQSAVVWVSSVYLIGGSDSANSRIAIASFAHGQAYELTQLTGDVTALIGSASVPDGDYSQVRLVVDSARVTLRSPLVFLGGAATMLLQTPAAQQSGIRVNLGGNLHVASGQTATLVVDFDVSSNFVLTGSLAAPTGMIFRPVLHGTTTDMAASISGTVGPVSAHTELFAITSAGDTVATTFADSTSGAYELRYIDCRNSPITVAARATGYTTQTATVPLVAAENRTGVDFALTP